MKSIFEIQDDDAIEEEYAVPGYALTVRPVRSLLDGGVRLEVYFGGRHDHYLTSTLRRFDGEQRGRDLMIRVGLWLQKECARIGAPSDLTTAKRADEIIERAILGREIRESPEGDFLIECLRSDGVEVESVSYDLLGDRFDVECRFNGQCFTAGVPVKAVRRGLVSQVQDHVRCPWCGSHETAGQVTVVCDDGVDRLCRRTCGECKDRTRDLEALFDLFRALHALPTPVADATAALIAEQCAAGGVDCDATRRAAFRRVKLEAAMAELVCDHVRLVHDPKLRWYGMAPKDLLAAVRRLVNEHTKRHVEADLPPGWRFMVIDGVPMVVSTPRPVNGGPIELKGGTGDGGTVATEQRSA